MTRKAQDKGRVWKLRLTKRVEARAASGRKWHVPTNTSYYIVARGRHCSHNIPTTTTQNAQTHRESKHSTWNILNFQ